MLWLMILNGSRAQNMTNTFDKLMIRAGFDAREIEQVKGRHFLYAGNMAMLVLSGLFLALLVL